MEPLTFFSFSLLSGNRKQCSLFKTAKQAKGMYVGLLECWGNKREERLSLEESEERPGNDRKRENAPVTRDKKADGAQTEEAHLENRLLF